MQTTDLQQALADRGLYAGRVDGLDGPKTRAAIAALLAGPAGPGAAWQRWDAARRRIAASQLIMADAGIETGPVDGLAGPQTLAAIDAWEHLKATGTLPAWRDAAMAPAEGDARFPAPVRTTWPRQRDVERHFGAVGVNQAMLELPFPMRLAWDTARAVTRFSIHERVHDSAARVFARVLDHYGPAEIARLRLDLFGGCLNVRRMRGGSAWSMHSWGIAIDFDPERNRLRWGRDRASLAGQDYAPFWRAWADEGWLSLGHARDFDWMHVQAARL